MTGKVNRDGAETVAKVVDNRQPRLAIESQPVQEHDWYTGSGALESELRSVVNRTKGHLTSYEFRYAVT